MLLGFVALLVLPALTEAATIDVYTAEELVNAFRQFANNGNDTTVHLFKNLTFQGVNTSSWPVRGLSRGTITIKPSFNSTGKLYIDAYG